MGQKSGITYTDFFAIGSAWKSKKPACRFLPTGPTTEYT